MLDTTGLPSLNFSPAPRTSSTTSAACIAVGTCRKAYRVGVGLGVGVRARRSAAQPHCNLAVQMFEDSSLRMLTLLWLSPFSRPVLCFRRTESICSVASSNKAQAGQGQTKDETPTKGASGATQGKNPRC